MLALVMADLSESQRETLANVKGKGKSGKSKGGKGSGVRPVLPATPEPMVSSNNEWCLKGAKGIQGEDGDGASMILVWILDALRLCAAGMLTS